MMRDDTREEGFAPQDRLVEIGVERPESKRPKEVVVGLLGPGARGVKVGAFKHDVRVEGPRRTASSKAASASAHRWRSIQARARVVGSGPKKVGSSRLRLPNSGGPPSRSSCSRRWRQAALSSAWTEPCSSSSRPVATLAQSAKRGRSSGYSETVQSRAVLSSLPGEDGLAVRAERHGLTSPWCARGGPMGLPVAASQSRAVLVPTAGEDGLAVRAERHGRDRVLVPQGRADGLAGGGVPEPRRLVTSCR